MLSQKPSKRHITIIYYFLLNNKLLVLFFLYAISDFYDRVDIMT